MRWPTSEHGMTGIVVPGLSDAPGAEHDPSNLCLLEATSGSGVVCRPLLTVSWWLVAFSDSFKYSEEAQQSHTFFKHWLITQ